MSTQIFFDFSPHPELRANSGAAQKKHGCGHNEQRHHRIRQALRRAALLWLVNEKNATGLDTGEQLAIGLDVPTRGSTLRADIGAVCFHTHRKMIGTRSSSLLLTPVCTTAFISAVCREDCWPECAEPDCVIAEIHHLHDMLEGIETRIRKNEPHLREVGMLFEEYASWNYNASTDEEYHRVKRQLNALEKTLYCGSRMERIAQANAANEIILLVPKGIITAEDVRDTWGILEVDPHTLQAALVKKPQTIQAPVELQHNFAMNIALASTRYACTCNGIHLQDNGFAKPVRMPTIRKR